MATDVGSIIARLILDRSQFTDSLAAARAEAKAFPDVKVGMNSKQFDAEWVRLMAMKKQLDSPDEVRTSFAASGLAGIEAMKAAASKGFDIPARFKVDATGLVLPEALAREAPTSSLLSNFLAAGGGGGNRRTDIFYHASGGGDGGGGGAAAAAGFDGGALSSKLLFGGGSTIPFLGTLAGLGSLASFAGLGPEHLLMTAAGLGGSAIGGALGGGLLGLGAAGVAGTGMATDLAGIGQAAGDIKTVSTDMSALSQATAEFGKNSTQAKDAQAQLNYDLASFSPLARTAVVQAAVTAQGFKSMFDQATGQAESTGAQIITQLMQVGEKFLPTIGKFAAENMGIIQKGIQPLLAWIGTQGLGIFQNLEQEFTSRLPTAIHAGTQAFELLAKTIDLASTYTGTLMPKIDAFLTKMNTPAGFQKWSDDVGKLIADFHLWEGLILAVGRDITDLFHNDAGTATGIVTALTQMLDKLGAWERSTSGSNQLHNIFEVHKQEILSLLALLPSLLSSLGHIYLSVAPALTAAFTTVLRAIAPVLNALAKNPVGAWVLGLTILASKLGLLSGLLGSAGGALGSFVRNSAVGLAGLVVPEAFLARLGLVTVAADDAGVAVGAHFAASAETGAAGAEGALGGLLGPIGLAVGATAGFVALWVALEKHAPSASAAAAKGIGLIDSALSSMPMNDLNQMKEDLLNINSYLGFTASKMQGLKPGSTALETAAGKTEALYSAQQKLASQAGITAANISILSKSFGISATDAQGLAQQVGINLGNALRPGDVNIFKAAIAQSGDTYNATAPKAANFAAAVATASQKAVASVDQMNGQTTSLMATYKQIMGSGSVIAMADFINGQRGGLPAVLANSREWGINIPGPIQNALLKSMTSTGQISMSNLSKAIGAGGPLLAGSLKNINFQVVAGFSFLPPAAGAIGAAAMAALAAAISNYGAAAIGAAQAVAAGVGSALRSAEASAAAGAASIAGTAAQAVASAAAAEQAVAKAASLNGAASVTGHATGTPFASGGMAWVGEQGPELMNVPRGAQIFNNRKSMEMAGGGVTLSDHRTININGGNASTEQIRQVVCKELDRHDAEMLATLKQMAGVGT